MNYRDIAIASTFCVTWADGSTENFTDIGEAHLAIDAAYTHATARPGSISHGTMREEDLIPVFVEHLRHLAMNAQPVIAPDKRHAHLKLCDEAMELLTLADDDEKSDPLYIGETIHELFDALNDFSPEGHSFGAHEGDGSDYGWWQVEDSDSAYDSDLIPAGGEETAADALEAFAADAGAWEEREATKLKLGSAVRVIPINGDLIARIKGALGTEEDGDDLVEVARAAHKAEQALTTAIGILREVDDARRLADGKLPTPVVDGLIAFLAEHD